MVKALTHAKGRAATQKETAIVHANAAWAMHWHVTAQVAMHHPRCIGKSQAPLSCRVRFENTHSPLKQATDTRSEQQAMITALQVMPVGIWTAASQIP